MCSNTFYGCCCVFTHYFLFFTAFVTTLLYNVSTDLWVGLTSDSKGHFQWAKASLLSYTNWAPGEPLDNSGPHHNKTPVLTAPPPISTRGHGVALHLFVF